MNEKEDMEQQLSELLTSDEADREDPEAEARKKLPPRYEIRVQAERDPIVEETKKYRKIAKEVDDRYDKYMTKE